MQDLSQSFAPSFKPPGDTAVSPWAEAIFSAKAVARGGIVRRAVRDVEREMGRAAFVGEVQARGFHLAECGGQFIVICNAGHLKVIC